MADDYERDEHLERLIAVAEEIQSLADAEAGPLDPADFAPGADLRHVRDLQCVDSGFLLAARHIVLAAVPEDYAGLKAYHERDMERRLRRALAAFEVKL